VTNKTEEGNNIMQRIDTLLPPSLIETAIPPWGNTAYPTHIPKESLFASPRTPYLPTPTIMVIESSQAVKTIIEICLRSEGYPVISFTDSAEALIWLAQQSLSMPELVLLDSSLSKMSRYKFTQVLNTRQQDKKITIILLSQYDGTIDHLTGHMEGITTYLPRPFTVRQIVELAQRYLDERIGVN
jgi:CheY-like chemotaxis protein